MAQEPKTTAVSRSSIDRRQFVKQSAILVSAGAAASTAATATADVQPSVTEIGFPKHNSLVHPPEWESLNPGFWKIETRLVRRSTIA